LFFFFCGSIILQAQDKSLLYKARKFYIEANTLLNSDSATPQTDWLAYTKYKQALELYLQAKEVNDTLADIYLQIGLCYHFGLDNSNHQAAYEAYKNALKVYEIIHKSSNFVLFKPYVLLGQASLNLNNHTQAEEYFNKAKVILSVYGQEVTTSYPEYVDTFYNLFGFLYYQLGNYRQCINYFNKSIEVLKRSNLTDDSKTQIVINSINVATANAKLNQFNKALEGFQALLKYNIFTDEIYYNIGFTYLQKQQYVDALIFFKKDKATTPIHKVKLNNNLATTYFFLNNLKQAALYYNESIQLNKQNNVLSLTEMAHSSLGKGRVYEVQNDYRQALQQYQTAIRYLHTSFSATDPYQNPADFTKAISKLDLFEVLNAKARALQLLFGQTKHLPDLEASLQTYQLSIQLADQIRKSYDSDDAKLFFNKTIFPVYEEAMGVTFQLFQQTHDRTYLTTAFAFSEASKAAVLAESLRDVDIKKIPGIPDSLLTQERQLKRNLTAWNLRLVDEKDSVQKVTLQNRIRDDEIRLAQLLKEFEKNPQYYRLKYDTGSVDVAALQQNTLDKPTALLEYFVGKDKLYAFVITSDGLEARQWPLSPYFRADLEKFRQGLYAQKPGTRYAGDELAFRLYGQLMAPLAALLKGKERLVIVPDAELSYLPFEALTTGTNQQYLLRDFTISYAYSGKLLESSRDQRNVLASNALLAMAPFAGEAEADKPTLQATVRSEALLPLSASRQEVEAIGGKAYLTEEATKDQFLRSAAFYGIIHLATHAQADNEDPLRSYIAFYPDDKDSLAGYRLYAQELYNMRLENVRLVVLSACETGSGQLVRGEGVMSLARAFAYAGCPSIVTTLWKADDQSTANITARMHQYLKEGKARDQALRLAKLDYIEQQTDPRKKSPYYWAHFVFIGDHTPLYAGNGWVIWTMVSLLVAGLLMGVYYWYRKTIRKQDVGAVRAGAGTPV
jgi:CHAT domain-containing protein